MRLTMAAENSIMILYLLARGKRRFSVAELSAELATPANHIYKLVQALVRGKYVKSFSGKVGGVELVGAPNRITLLEVVEHIEGPIRIANCFLREKVCRLQNECALKIKLEEAYQKVRKVLKGTTIQGLVNLSAKRRC